MKYIILITLSAFVLGCKKEKFTAPPEFEKLIGTWDNVNGDSKLSIEIDKSGKIKSYSEFERTEKIQAVNCSYTPNKFTFEVSTGVYKRSLYTSDNFDTISRLMGAFNQPDSSVNYLISFVKRK